MGLVLLQDEPLYHKGMVLMAHSLHDLELLEEIDAILFSEEGERPMIEILVPTIQGLAFRAKEAEQEAAKLSKDLGRH